MLKKREEAVIELAPVEPVKVKADDADIQANKGMAIIAYILFFVPLIAARDSKYAMYHANQGLTLFLTGLVLNTILLLIPAIGIILFPFINFALFALVVFGIFTASQNLTRPLPIIGGYTLLK